MSRARPLLAWLEDKSDLLSPIVVKEVRQIVRGREFNYAFGASLVVGLGVAFFGAADALAGNGTAGRWTFTALMFGLAVLGIGVVPLGAFSALRNERMEQTLDLVTLTALSPRRVIIGKLLAQGVKLLTLFAAIAPFIATSFLLGGIDFLTILVWLLIVFMWSLWGSALCLFLSTLFKSRAMSGIVFGAFGLALFLLFLLVRSAVGVIRFGGTPGPLSPGTAPWWVLAVMGSICVVTMINLVLLAENRLTLPTENRVTRLRAGFFVQFLLIIGWMLTFINETPNLKSNAVEGLVILGGLHLTLVAIFTVSEDLVVPRRVLQQLGRTKGWSWLAALFMPGGGRGATYVLAQMGLLFLTAWVLDASWQALRQLVTMCGYICFFTGVPALAWRVVEPEREGALRVRLSILMLAFASTVLPDLVHYVFVQPDVLDLSYGARHVVNPFRTMANWRVVEVAEWFTIPFALGVAGLIAYVILIYHGMRVTQGPVSVSPLGTTPAAEEAGSANALY
ncbi:MAG TPA: hypothetical protein VGD94_12660 [Vicinamibacterales bacterium]